MPFGLSKHPPHHPSGDGRRSAWESRRCHLCEGQRVAELRPRHPTQGALNYYKLTREGFRLLRGNVAEPSASFFAEISVSRQKHTRALAEVVAHTLATGHRHGVRLVDFRPENQLTLQLGEQQLKPDFQLTLAAPTGQHFRFLLELDNSTEPVTSSQPHRESIERKLAFYERYQNHWFAQWKQAGRLGLRRFESEGVGSEWNEGSTPFHELDYAPG